MRPLVSAFCAALLVFAQSARADTLFSEERPRSRRTPWPQPALGTSRSGEPEVMFTFDDGPESGSTEKILDVLAEHGVRAVFFVVGHRLKRTRGHAKAMVDRMIDEKHLVGNHSTNHVDLCLPEHRGDIDFEIDETAFVIRKLASVSAPLFRAPYGARCALLERSLAERGITHLHWDIDAQEWRFHDADYTAATIIQKIRTLRDDQRAVVLIHDTKDSSARALPRILDWIAGENRQRVQAGRAPIRILDPAEVALEQLAPGVAPALAEAAETIFGFLPDLERRIFGPLAPLAKASL